MLCNVCHTRASWLRLSAISRKPSSAKAVFALLGSQYGGGSRLSACRHGAAGVGQRSSLEVKQGRGAGGGVHPAAL